jgi:hypothetical protein
MAKKSTAEDEKFSRQDFDLFQAIEQIDRKNYDYFQSLSEEQRKKFVPFMLTHWISAVKGSSEISSYYLMSTNICANTHLFNEHVQSHPDLQWKMLCAASPGMGKQYHQWIPHLSNKITTLSEPTKKKEIADYLKKICKNESADVIDETAKSLADNFNLKYKLGTIYKNLKFDEIELLSKLVSEEEIKTYDSENGY